jgi:hypothetical protein
MNVASKTHMVFLGALSQVLPSPGELLTMADSS